MTKIDLRKLKNAVEKNGKTIARCPACAARGGDSKGEHLVVFPDGKFGCVANPRDNPHKRQILELAGCDAEEAYQVPVKRVFHAPPKVIQIVGRFGRCLETTPSVETSAIKGSVTITAEITAVQKVCPPRPQNLTADVAAEESSTTSHTANDEHLSEAEDAEQMARITSSVNFEKHSSRSRR